MKTIIYPLLLLLLLVSVSCGRQDQQDINFAESYRQSIEKKGGEHNPIDSRLRKTYMRYLKEDKKYGSEGIRVLQELSRDTEVVLKSILYESDGLNISGLLAEPARGGEGLPGIVVCHGFYRPETYFSGQGTRDTIELIASKGYVVLMTDYRGYGRSEGSSKLDYPGEFVDSMNAIQALRKYPSVDPERIGIIGYSWGGGFALRCLMIDDRLRAGVLYYPELGGINAPKPNMYRFLQQMGLNEFYIEDYFKKWSPLFYTPWMKAPLLVFHGEKDRVVLPDQSRALVDMMKQNNKQVELVLFPRLRHAFADNPNNLSMDKLFEFLREHLGN